MNTDKSYDRKDWFTCPLETLTICTVTHFKKHTIAHLLQGQRATQNRLLNKIIVRADREENEKYM